MVPWEKEDGGKKGGCGSALESVDLPWRVWCMLESCWGVYVGVPVGVFCVGKTLL